MQHKFSEKFTNSNRKGNAVLLLGWTGRCWRCTRGCFGCQCVGLDLRSSCDKADWSRSLPAYCLCWHCARNSNQALSFSVFEVKHIKQIHVIYIYIYACSYISKLFFKIYVEIILIREFPLDLCVQIKLLVNLHS